MSNLAISSQISLVNAHIQALNVHDQKLFESYNRVRLHRFSVNSDFESRLISENLKYSPQEDLWWFLVIFGT